MKNRILGLVGLLWGGAVLFRYFTSEPAAATTNSAYQTGQKGAVVFAACMAIIGAYYLLRPSGK